MIVSRGRSQRWHHICVSGGPAGAAIKDRLAAAALGTATARRAVT